MSATSSTVPHVRRLFLDCDEQTTPQPGVVVEGRTPSWLCGSLYRIGPAKFRMAPDYSVRHWFDGLAMVCRLAVHVDGSSSLQKRFVRSRAYSKALAHGRNIYTEFGTRGHTDPSRWLFARLLASVLPTDVTDNAFHNVYVLNGRLFAAGETTFVHHIDPLSLETGERVDLHSCLGVNLCSSHPQLDEDDSVLTLGVSFFPSFNYQINRVLASPVSDNAASAAFSHNRVLLNLYSSSLTSYSYYHTFAVTDHHIVFLELPLLLLLSRVMTMVAKGKCLRDCIQWQPEQGVRVHVFNKRNGRRIDVHFYADQPFFQAHMANAYEQDNQIVIDMITYAGASILDMFQLDKLREDRINVEHLARVSRMVVPLGTRLDSVSTTSTGVDHKDDVGATENLVSVAGSTASAVRQSDGRVLLSVDHYSEPLCVDYPVINPRMKRQPHRYVYVSAVLADGAMQNRVGRLDMRERRWSCWDAGRGYHPSEVEFVAAPDSTTADAELNGVLLVTVTGTQADVCGDYLAVIDAVHMTTMAKISFSSPIPYLIHGKWLFDSEVEQLHRVCHGKTKN